MKFFILEMALFISSFLFMDTKIYGIVIHETATFEQHESLAANYPAVGEIRTSNARGTGFLVEIQGKQAVVTAAHVLDGEKKADIIFPNAYENGQPIKRRLISWEPYSGRGDIEKAWNSIIPSCDFAVSFLEKDVSGVPSLALSPEPHINSEESLIPSIVVGFGETGVFGKNLEGDYLPNPNPILPKAAKTLLIKDVDPGSKLLTSKVEAKTLDNSLPQLLGSVAQGDSGGPIIEELTGNVIGLVAFGKPYTKEYKNASHLYKTFHNIIKELKDILDFEFLDTFLKSFQIPQFNIKEGWSGTQITPNIIKFIEQAVERGVLMYSLD